MNFLRSRRGIITCSISNGKLYSIRTVRGSNIAGFCLGGRTAPGIGVSGVDSFMLRKCRMGAPSLSCSTEALFFTTEDVSGASCSLCGDRFGGKE